MNAQTAANGSTRARHSSDINSGAIYKNLSEENFAAENATEHVKVIMETAIALFSTGLTMNIFSAALSRFAVASIHPFHPVHVNVAAVLHQHKLDETAITFL